MKKKTFITMSVTALTLLSVSGASAITINFDIPTYEPDTPTSFVAPPVEIEPITVEGITSSYQPPTFAPIQASDYEMPDIDAFELEPEEITPEVEDFNAEFVTNVQDLNIDSESTTIDPNTGEFILASDTLFDVNESELKPEGKESLRKFFGEYASLITDDEHRDKLAYVDFAGHTDSSGSYEYNVQLSLDRGTSVYNFCVSECIDNLTDEQKQALVAASHVNGYAYTRPVLDENGEEDKDASRRVTIRCYFDSEKISE